MRRKKIISIDVTIGSKADFIEQIVTFGRARQASYVCLANVHMCVEAYRDKTFANVVNCADLISADGMPLVKALKLFYGIDQDRLAGMDLLPDLIAASEHGGLSVYLYGSTDKVLSAISKRIAEEHPGLVFAGAYAPPFRAQTPDEEVEEVRKINCSGANIVFVALGCPKQERWMARNRDKIHAVLVGVGGAFPVYAGFQTRAPLWMQRYSLEWLFRLFQEPARLWKRYLVTNSIFFALLISEKCRMMLMKKGSTQ
ncbi:WecB/TagA/CpsF family glycosyltransferase [bacterium]|nr:MAG: WecB/TagA/CpsF family glycosyltransferase [bacterium]